MKYYGAMIALLFALFSPSVQSAEGTTVCRELIPGAAVTLSGEVAESGARLRVRFGDELGAAAGADFSAPVRGRFEVRFEAPEMAATASVSCVDASGRPAAAKNLAWYIHPVIPPRDPAYWNGAWIWGDNEFKPRAHCYLRRRFEVSDPKGIIKAVFQWATDDRSRVFLNGRELGTVSSWAVPAQREIAPELLRRGENVLAVEAFNNAGDAGFLGELSLIGRDGTVHSVPSGAEYRYASQVPAGTWRMPGFDDASWAPARIKCYPPQNPYGAVRFRYFGKRFQGRVLSRALPKALPAGARIRVSGVYSPLSGDGELPEEAVRLSLRRGGVELAAYPLVSKRAGNRLEISGELELPMVFAGEVVDLVPASSRIDFAPLGENLRVTGSLHASTHAEVRMVSGAPRLFLDGRPEALMLYRAPINERNRTDAYRFMRGMERNAGIRLFEVSLRLARLWRSSGEIDFAALENNLLAALAYAPHGKLVVFINTDAPAWYVARHPEECAVFENGKSAGRISFASERYRRDASEVLGKMLRLLRDRPVSRAIAGFGLDAGEDGQWMQWTGRNLENLGDFGLPMRQAFTGALARRFKEVAALNQKAGTAYRSFSEVPIPGKAIRNRAAPLHFDPARDAAAAVYQEAFSDAVTDTLLAFARAIKTNAGPGKILGAYYGKCFSICGFSEWGEFGVGKVLASPDVDYLIGVEYLQRAAGSPHSASAPMASYAFHGKLFVDEGDLRTFTGGTRAWGYAGGLADTVSMIRKMFLYSFSKNHGIHWYDLHGGAFEHPAILAAIGRVRKIAAENVLMPARRGDIAFFFDESGLTRVSGAYKNVTRASLLHQQNGAFKRIGAEFDLWLQSDLLDPRFPKYKMYVFLNGFHADAAMRRAVDRLKRNGALLVFLTNSGLDDGTALAAENIRSLTGLPCVAVPPGTPQVMKSVRTGAYSSSGAWTPVFAPRESADVEVWGRFPSGAAAAVLRDFGSWRSFYSAVPALTPAMWRDLARLAGCFVYSEDPGVMTYIGSELVGAHTAKPGTHRLRFPERADFTDAVTGRTVARDTAEPELVFDRNETKLLRMRR